MRRVRGEGPQVSSMIRFMQRPLSKQCSKVEGGGGASELERRKEEEEGTKGEERKGPSGFIYKEKRIKWQAQESRSLKRQRWRACRLDFWDSINEGNLFNLFIQR